jgi:hypothetical protein
MNNLHSMRHALPVSPAMQPMLKLQSAASKASSVSFEQYLNAQLNTSATRTQGITGQSFVASQTLATPTIPSNTPSSVAAQLFAANQPPPGQPLEPVTAPLYSPTYMQQFTYNGFVNQANQQNQKTAAVYQLDMNNWALNENQRQSLGLPEQPPPAAPQYVAVNSAGYNQWWSSLSNLGNPAPVDFITPIAS